MRKTTNFINTKLKTLQRKIRNYKNLIYNDAVLKKILQPESLVGFIYIRVIYSPAKTTPFRSIIFAY